MRETRNYSGVVNKLGRDEIVLGLMLPSPKTGSKVYFRSEAVMKNMQDSSFILEF